MQAPAPPQHPFPRVAVVDDEPLVLRALARTLASAGFEPVSFRGPEAALAGLAAAAPAVIVSDYQMALMDGVELLKWARAAVPGAARILCTAVAEFEVAAEAVNAGEVQRIVAKPWHIPDLVAAVRQAAEASRARAERERELGGLRESNARLERLAGRRGRTLLDGLEAALHCRDGETHLHSVRVMRLARRLAERLGLDAAALAAVEQGALLHDIGKIGVPDAVLRKPAALSGPERAEMRRHPELGWELLRNLGELGPVARVVLQHHERWDGAGYPGGLRGEAIAVEARVFHLADAFDAMSSPRPYRPARSPGEIADEIRRGRGSDFDPAAVDAFREADPGEWERVRAG
jgi:putative nucleotidyltransferase with HDIG domain